MASESGFVTDADNREMLEYDGASGAPLRWYAHRLGPNDALNQMNLAAATRTAFVPDLQGSVVATLDSATGAFTKANYLPYGGSSSSGGTFRYTGQRIDAETGGLYYYRARVYRPAWGRFMQTDPSGTQGGSNLYAYVGNDPLNAVDPTGLASDLNWGGSALSAYSVPLPSASSETLLGVEPGPGSAVFIAPPVQLAAMDESERQRIMSGQKPDLGGGGGGGGAPRSLSDLIGNSVPGRTTTGPTTQYERPGGYGAAQSDFNALGPTNIRPAPNNQNVQLGTLPDGKTISVRPNSTDGRPTLEIYDPATGNSIKFRYSN